jgi:hypothetical protein
LSETAATPFIQSDDRPNPIARLFQLPVLQGRLLRDAKTEAEHCCRPLHLQKLQHDGAPVVGQPIQFYELDGTARLTATAASQLGEQLGTRLGELHKGAAIMHNEPTALDCEPQAGAVLGRRSALLVEKRRVDLLDVDWPSCTGSIVLAISTSLRAAVSGSA